MTGPAAAVRQEPMPFDEQEYERLTRRMGRILARAVPSGWRRIDLKILMTVGATDLALTVIMRDGSSPIIDPPHDLVGIAARLRSMMYRPGEGTWFGMRYMMDPPSAYWVSFNHRFDPFWDPPIPAELWARDLAVFPRTEAGVPTWLRARIHTAPGDDQ